MPHVQGYESKRCFLIIERSIVANHENKTLHSSTMKLASWEVAVISRRKELDEQIPKEWRIELPIPDELPCVQNHISVAQLLTSTESEITATKTTKLIEHLKKREIDSRNDRHSFFCKRAAIAQQALNCATDLLFDEALAIAREYDIHFQLTGKTKEPLHGLPIFIKDALDIAGHLTITGLVSRLNHVARNDTLSVSMLRDAGALPLIKTNISQACLLVEPINNIHGTVMVPRIGT